MNENNFEPMPVSAEPTAETGVNNEQFAEPTADTLPVISTEPSPELLAMREQDEQHAEQAVAELRAELGLIDDVENPEILEEENEQESEVLLTQEKRFVTSMFTMFQTLSEEEIKVVAFEGIIDALELPEPLNTFIKFLFTKTIVQKKIQMLASYYQEGIVTVDALLERDPEFFDDDMEEVVNMLEEQDLFKQLPESSETVLEDESEIELSRALPESTVEKRDPADVLGGEYVDFEEVPLNTE